MAVGPTLEDTFHARRRIVDVARRIENGEMDLFVGCRRIADLRGGLTDEELDDSDLAVFVAVDSELDGYPMGSSRAHWATEALAEKDHQRLTYLDRVREEVLRACQALILKWGSIS